MFIQNINNKNLSNSNSRFLNSTALELNILEAQATYKVKKHVIFDAFNNRKNVIALAKNASGVYIFSTSNGGLYVGSSIELYSRVSHYFRPSVIAKANRHILHHFKKHGLNNITLTLLIFEEEATIEMVRTLEQYFIDTLRPDLNETSTVLGPGLPSKLSRKVYVYDNKTLTLVHISKSLLYLENNLSMCRDTIIKCANSNLLFLNRFLFSFDPILSGYVESLLTIAELTNIIDEERKIAPPPIRT